MLSVLGILLIVLNICFFLVQKKKKGIIVQSTKDSLTGLQNREALIYKLKRLAVDSTPFYLFFCDLDNFKQLNDTLGHAAGDALLKNIAEIWSKLRYDYSLYRLGGDEFAVILNGDFVKAESLANEMLETLQNQKSKYFTNITASIGIARFPIDSNDIDKLLIFADSSMYKAKQNGKNNFHFFDRDIYNEIMQNFRVEKILTEAIESDAFEIVYQAQYSKDHKLLGYEALTRLKDENNRYLDTQTFILVAENTGMIIDVDRLILRKVLKEFKTFLKVDPNLEVSVNISGKHVGLPNFADVVYKACKDLDFPTKNLKLEITESSYIKQMDAAITQISRLKRLGIKIALDDFGTGYSSLRYLLKLPMDTIKIDKSFVDSMLENSSLVNLIINIAHLMDCKVIAEGVENEKQLEMLKMLGCDDIQGFIFAKPEHAPKAINNLKNELD